MSLGLLSDPSGVRRGLRGAGAFERTLERLLASVGIDRPPGSLLARRAFRARLGAGRSLSSQIRRAQDHVDLHLGEIRTIDDLAQVAGLSRFHFAHRFREEVGEPPWAYVRRARDERAVQRLEDGVSPAEVAFETGYADQPHLTRSLRARYGRTPGQIQSAGAPAPDGESEPDDRKDVQDAAGEAT